MFVLSPEDSSNSHIWTTLKRDQKFFHFEVAACSDAIVTLASDVEEYEITIKSRGSGNSLLKKMVDGDFEEVASGENPKTLQCNHPKYYWVAWDEGEVKVGAGSLWNDEFLAFRDEDPSVKVCAVSLKTGQSEGYWDFVQEQGRFLTCTVGSISTLAIKLSLYP